MKRDPTKEQIKTASQKLSDAFNKANEGMDIEWVNKRSRELIGFVRDWCEPTDLGYMLFLADAKVSMVAINHAMQEAEKQGKDTKEGILDFASEMLGAVLNLYAIAEGRMMADAERRERKVKEEKTVIICDLASIPSIIPGTSEGKCSECERAINVAPSSWAFLAKRPDVALLCSECGVKAAEEADEVVTVGRVPGAEPQPKK